MIKIPTNPKYTSFAQCNRCGRKVFSTKHTEEEITAEKRLDGWTVWDHNVCYCEDCKKVMEKENG